MRPQTRAEQTLSTLADVPGRGASPRSVLVGLIGAGIQASRSPALHEREAEALGLRCIYQLVDLDLLGLPVDVAGDLVTAAQRLGFAGLNVTHPCKQAIVPTLDGLSPEAEAIGAVNTVVFDAGRRIGHNTDAHGFAESLRRGLADARLDRVVQIGAGGAGAAVAHAVLSLGAGTVTLVDLDGDRAEALADRLRRRFGGGRATAVRDPAPALAGADGLVNATPVGMARYPGSPVPEALMRPGLWVADIVYTPLETELLRAARRLGCRTLAGGGMAVFQAAEAFRLFTGIAPDAARMLRHFESMCAAGADRPVDQPHRKGG
ncbi:MAG: shikimate dehydrogenase [Alphaproteobacteria bacterium]|nr:shikimate dehydrogenase [Alphaproteobacteria bacterium]